MKPLVCEAFWNSQPSRAEKWLAWIPILGWAGSAALERARFRPMVRSLEQQLRARPDTAGLWGSDPRRQEGATAIRMILKEELGWPNDHFIPADPFGLVFWAHEDGLDGVSAANRIEQQLGVRLRESEWERLWRHGTLGEFVDQLITPGQGG